MPDNQDDQDNRDNPETGRTRMGRGKLMALIAGIAVAAGAALGAQALADGKAYGHFKLLASQAGGHGGWRADRRHHGGFAEMSEAEIDARIQRMVKHGAIEIDATQEQQEKITALLRAAAKDLKPLRQQMRDAAGEIHTMLLQDTIDREALEKLRADRLAEADRVSGNLIKAIADVAEVLSPEQRKVLDARIRDFRSMRGWRHRG